MKDRRRTFYGGRWERTDKKLERVVACNYPDCDGGPATGYCTPECESLAHSGKSAAAMHDASMGNFRIVVGGDGPGVNVFELYNVGTSMRYRRNGDLEVLVKSECLSIVTALAHQVIKQQHMIDELERRWEESALVGRDDTAND